MYVRGKRGRRKKSAYYGAWVAKAADLPILTQVSPSRRLRWDASLYARLQRCQHHLYAALEVLGGGLLPNLAEVTAVEGVFLAAGHARVVAHEPLVERHADDAVAREATAIVGHTRSGLKNPSGNLDHYRPPR